MTITKDNMGDLLNILLGENKREIMNRFTDAELVTLQANLDAVLSAADVFPASDINALLTVDNLEAVSADPAVAVAIANYATSNFNDLATDYAGFRERIEDYVEDNFAAVMAVPEVAAELEAYIIANVTTLGADTEIRAAFVAAGWTAPA